MPGRARGRRLTHLNAGRADGTYERRFNNLARVELLIIDDFGLKTLKPPADEDFHELVAERYERGAIVLTSNLDFGEWGNAFANPLLASATIDRLRHNAHCLTNEGESYRSPRSMNSKERNGKPIAKAKPMNGPDSPVDVPRK